MRDFTGFPDMHTIVPEGEKGTAKVKHYDVGKGDSFRTMLSHRPGLTHVPEGRYCKLIVDGYLVMSDTQMERSSNLTFILNANGHVLIGGLGLGMIVHPLMSNDDVSTVTVVERSPDVIDLIQPTLPNGKPVTVICADIFEWDRDRSIKYDTIYFDIWPDICEDNLKEIARLHQRYKYALNRENEKCWMGSWMQSFLRSERRAEQRQGGFWV